MPTSDTTASRQPMTAYLAHVPVTKRRKPFWGNLALATTLLLVNGFRITFFLTAAVLSAEGNLLDPRRYR